MFFLYHIYGDIMRYISKKEISKNNLFMRMKTYFNNKLFLVKEGIICKKILGNINGYKLDKQQEQVVFMDEENLLVVAGAGSGKTLTMLGKVKYLVERQKVDSSKILVISFTNFTTESFKKSISKNMNYNIDVLTFHKLGLNILKQAKIKFKICLDDMLKNITNNYLKNELLNDQKSIYKFLKYFLMYDIKLLETYFDNMNSEEKIICNFLYCNNIKYTYRPLKIIDDKVIYGIYLDDYDIYIRHEMFDSLFDEKDYGVNVIVTNSYIFTFEDIFGYLYDEFRRKNVKLDSSRYLEMCELFLLKGNKIENLSNLIITFINMMKSYNYDIKKIDFVKKKVYKISNKMEKEKLLFTLDLIEKVYVKYQMYLSTNEKIDFNDIINISSSLIKNGDAILNYKYIIIDEFQDTSYTRYKLIKSIQEMTGAKLIAVGDDFQSIYRFTGCDLNLFLNFEKNFKFSKIVYLTNTYRNSNELISLAGNFIMKNKYQIHKKLKSNKSIRKPVKIYFYKNKNEINKLISKIIEKNIFVLGRNNRDIDYIDDVTKDKKIIFMSIHKSKGLESEGVLMVNLEDSTLGFPSKIPSDILISYLCNNKEYYPYEEERRLFYVALTRTKNNVYLFVPLKNPSIFVKEIVKNYKKYIEFIN